MGRPEIYKEIKEVESKGSPTKMSISYFDLLISLFKSQVVKLLSIQELLTRIHIDLEAYMRGENGQFWGLKSQNGCLAVGFD